jgi:hypothetical protein
MTERMLPNVEVIDLPPGLWIWRLEHPAWNPDVDWQQVVTCVCVDAGGERCLLDPLLPPDDATQVWDRLAERPPTAVAVLSPDHMRRTWGDRRTKSVDAVVRRYGCRAFGPAVFDPDHGPLTPHCTRSCQTTNFPVACSRSGILGAGTRRRSGFPNTGPWFLPTR